MAKQSGKVEAAPPKEGIELQVEGMVFNILMAVEKKIMESLANFTPPAAVTPLTQSPPAQKSVKTEEEVRIDKINRERLAAFAKSKETEKSGVSREEYEEFKRFQAMQRKGGG